MQAGVCAVCGKGARKRKLNVDHDHVTGKVRGLLCTRCNITLGKMRDKPPIGSALAKYIFHANSAKTPKIK